MTPYTHQGPAPDLRMLERWLSDCLCFADHDSGSEMFAPGHVHHEGARTWVGTSQFNTLLRLYPHCHEEIRVEFQSVIEDTQYATIFLSVSGRMVGPMPGQIPSGRRITRPMAWTFRRERGLIVESWHRASRLAPLREAEVARGGHAPPCAEPEGMVGTEKLGPLDGIPERCLWARKWKLGPRLSQTAVLLMNGYERREVAKSLGLKTSTVQSYIKELFAKSGVHGRIELARAASRIDHTRFP